MTSTLLHSEPTFERRRLSPVADATRPPLSIAIVTWNSAAWIEKCLQSIPEACGALEYEIVVVDNASSDDTAANVAAFNAHSLRLVESSENLGFAGGVNRALGGARGDYILLLNPDCELAPGSIEKLYAFLEKEKLAGAAVPLLLGDDGEPQREFQLRRLPTLRTLAVELLMLDKIVPSNRITSGYRYRDIDIARPQPIEQPAAAAMMIRREVIESIGPFDERFMPAWFEDVDYCRRMRERGETIWLVPDARATHHGGASLEHVSFRRFTEVWYENLFRYGDKWLSRDRVETLRWLVIAGMLLRISALLVGIPRRPATRREALTAFTSVLKRAFHRWDNSASPSS
jgi:N-acetylglucosaminyl-diphospho-decaprenol L-rhamnosyltransferase